MAHEASGEETLTAEQASLFARWIGDGRPLLAASAGALIFAGGFAIFLALTSDFLPQDVQFLGMTSDDLCRIQCRIVDFMVHDRASFGGALVGIGVLYLWLVSFPLAAGEEWAWWTLGLSGVFGFGSFLAYLGYGYLDTWHGIGTLLLLPVFALGLYRSWLSVSGQGDWVKRASLPSGLDRLSIGRMTIVIGGIGVVFSGLTILWIGVSDVFVAEDTHFIGSSRDEVDAISPQLIPLIAHDRAGFGGAVVVIGVITVMAVVFGKPTRSMFEAIALAGIISLGSAILIHLVVGYTDLWHLTPPILGALSLIIGIALAYPPVRSRASSSN